MKYDAEDKSKNVHKTQDRTSFKQFEKSLHPFIFSLSYIEDEMIQ